jgi:hypothetical protein
MKTFPLPALVAAVAALIAIPFSLAAACLLFVTAGLGFIIHADYTLRYRRIRLPRLASSAAAEIACVPFHREDHQLAA